MSFSSETKNELARIETDRKCDQLAEISGFLRMCGSVRLAGGGRMDVKLTTENPAIARRLIKLMKSYFGTKANLMVAESNLVKKGHFYELLITADMNAEQILREAGILRVQEGCNYISDDISTDLIKKRCCKKAFLRGAFLGAGTVSDPEKGYHMEIICSSALLAADVRRLINSFGLHSKVVHRKSNIGVYLKESEQIGDFLNLLGAHGQLLEFENVRVIKDVRNKTNRIVNCESANLDKTVGAAARQRESIRLIEERKGLDSLPDKLAEAAYLRKEHPEASLGELAEMCDPPMKKSGLNHRFTKLDEIAEKLRAARSPGTPKNRNGDGGF